MSSLISWFRCLHVVFCVGVMALGTLLGQVAPATLEPEVAPIVEVDEEIIELSPFVVTTSSDVGYLAQSTLAGSRLNTALADTPSAITAMTSELIADIGATSVEEALPYAVNNVRERFENDETPVGIGYVTADVTFRIRGLPSQRTRDFFPWSEEIDTYIVDRIDLSRGPNSILFGLGSPGGVVNVSTNRAQMRNRTELGARYTSFDTLRTHYDINREIIKDRLALRINFLRHEGQTWRANEYDNATRLHLASTWKIGANTEFRVEYERSERDISKNRPTGFIDNFSGWLLAGQPTYTNYTTTGTIRRPTGANAVPGISEYSTGTAYVYVENLGRVYNFRNFAIGSGPAQVIDPTTGAAISSSMRVGDLDSTILSPAANVVGPGQTQDRLTTWATAVLEHRFTKNWSVEMAVNYNDVSNRSWSVDWRRNTLRIDPNLSLPDATDHPFTEPGQAAYLAETQPILRTTEESNLNLRLTTAYDLDLRKVHSLLGTHRVAVLGETARQRRDQQNLQEYWVEGAPNVTNFTSTGNRVTRWTYIDPNDLSSVAFNFRDTVPINTTVPGTTTPLRSEMVGYDTNQNANDDKRLTYMGVIQSRWFKDFLITTIGARVVELERRIAPGIQAPLEGIYAGYTQSRPYIRGPSEDLEKVSASTYSTGAVAHLTRNISLIGNTSTSFGLPSSGAKIFPDGAEVPSPEGSGYDAGLQLRLFNDAVYFRSVYYATESRNQSQGRGNVNQRMASAYRLLDSYGLLNADLASLTADVNSYLYDEKSEGVETELAANLSRSWRLAFNVTRNRTARGKSGEEYLAAVNRFIGLAGRDTTSVPGDDVHIEYNTQGQIIGINYMALLESPPTTNNPAGLDPTDFTVSAFNTDWRTADPSTGANTIATMIAETVNGYDGDVTPTGEIPRGQREYTASLRISYTIRTAGPWRSLTVGGGIRYLGEGVVGYQVADDPTTAEVERRIQYGNDDVVVDANFGYTFTRLFGRPRTSLRFQVNINNVLDDDRLQVTRLMPNDTIRYYYYKNPREVIFAGTLQF